MYGPEQRDAFMENGSSWTHMNAGSPRRELGIRVGGCASRAEERLAVRRIKIHHFLSDNIYRRPGVKNTRASIAQIVTKIHDDGRDHDTVDLPSDVWRVADFAEFSGAPTRPRDAPLDRRIVGHALVTLALVVVEFAGTTGPDIVTLGQPPSVSMP
ncbi:hypothetical protein CC78DRAFT_574923 [Lojkania enalia]|uniref:Uncharacterized protein n=1 Tax=Lojkania enalia TaxID=147567 RepID=A0A9P4TPZ2_9PLEO|nr:hypothetical protein CC78DRAFT_574923 [Didymosphaeria enalia]